MPMFERPYLTLAYDDRGSGSPPLVFLHGWCDAGEIWASTIDAFAGVHRCLAPDMRGCGGSGLPAYHSFSAEALSNDVVAVCEAADVERPVLVGHSYGGYLAAEVVRRFPGFARAVVVEDQPLDLRALHAAMQPQLDVIFSAESHLAFRRAFLDSLISDRMSPRDRAMVEKRELATPIDVGQALWAAFLDMNADEIAARSEVLMSALGTLPALSIEAAPNPEYHATLTRLAPGVQTTVIESGHWIHLERPEEFRAALRGFLGEL